MRALEATVNEIFAAWPELYGFSVGRIEGFLSLEDVAADPWGAGVEELPRQIASVLLELIDEHPETAELLRGRTFARTLH
jgi:hypothetical protein